MIKLQKLEYVNLKAVHQLIGEYAPISSKMFAHIIDEALVNINKGYAFTSSRGRYQSDIPVISEALIGISDKLLRHNQSNKKNPWDLYDKLDFDILHECGDNVPTTTDVKAYFHYMQYARSPSQRRVVFHLNYNTFQGTKWSISFPVQIVMKGLSTIPDNHFGYAHSITLLGENKMPKGNQNYYIGVTKRNWLKRMKEHFYAVEKGSNKTFHKAWREYAGRSDVMLSSELITFNRSYDEIMKWEENEVDAVMKKGVSLNMIPGGFKGMKYLYKHRLASSDRTSLEDRQKAVTLYQKKHPRLGIPNLIISELWNDEGYVQRVICGVKGRLLVDQVRKIRKLNRNGMPIEKIVKLVNAKNIQQVQRVLDGTTYSRIN